VGMRPFFVSAVLLLFLFLGIVIGIEYAESGIRQVQGKDDAPSVAVEVDGEPVDISLLGKTVSGQPWASATEETSAASVAQNSAESQASVNANEIGTGNVYAEMGALIGSWIQQGARGLVELVLGWLDGLM